MRDLLAQEAMARWAEYLFYTGVLQILLAVLGTLALLMTLQHTRRANQIARDAVVSGQRAWILTDLLIDGPLSFSEYGVSINVQIKITNVGHGPALNVHTNVSLAFDVLDSTRDARAFAANNRQTGERWGRVCLPGETYFRPWAPSKTVEEYEAASVDGTKVNILVIGCVTYQVHGDSDLHQTTFSYLLAGDDLGGFEMGKSVIKRKLSYSVWSGGHAD